MQWLFTLWSKSARPSFIVKTKKFLSCKNFSLKVPQKYESLNIQFLDILKIKSDKY